MDKSTYHPRSEEAIARENALREPTPIITLPGYPEKFWDTTEPYLNAYPGSEPTLATKPPQSQPRLRSVPAPKPETPAPEPGPAPMAELLRVRREEKPFPPPMAWLVATLAGIALGALAWIVVAVSV